MMSIKILAVDDSTTVQKVISMTLAQESYQVVSALNEEELFSALNEESFNLILLDFSISQKKTGYALITEIQQKAPKTPILILLGQFDQVDEQALSSLGITEKLVKPFESQRFIERCRFLLEDAPKMEIASEPKKVLPTPQKIPSEAWSFPVPSVIGDETTNMAQIPPVIEEKEIPVAVACAESFPKGPAKEDLSYPEPTHEAPTTKLISADELAPEETDMSFADEQTAKLELGADFHSNLEEELHEESAEDFWMADIKEEKIEVEESKDFTIDKEELITKVQEAVPSLNQEEILAKLKEALPLIVEEYVKNYCKEAIEKVAWEVIPDLAENLIKTELKVISESVSKEQ